MLTRPVSTPLAIRRGLASGLGATRLSISTSIGRVPSRRQTVTTPGRYFLLPPGEEERGRVLDLDHPAVRHLEDPDLVRRPEAVLEGPQDPEALEPITLELEHRVDHVLQDARSRDGPLLRHVPHEDHRYALALGEPHEPRRALANLPDSARRPRELGRVERLDRIHYHSPRPLLENGRLDNVHVRLG